MNQTCDIVQDLLPLYMDEVCSDASRQMISEHLRTCPDCSRVWQDLNNNTVEIHLEAEKKEVLRRQSTFFKRRSALAGAVVAGILMIPVLICLIVNLAQGQGMNWFFVVLASLVLAASLIITPLMMPSNKCLWTLGLSAAALFLLLGVCCIYTDGNWFFVAGSATLFGLAVAFLPFVVRSRPLKALVKNQKGLVCMLADTVLFILMMVCIGDYVHQPDYPELAWKISLCLIIPAWILFAVLRYLPCRKLYRAGIVCILLGFMGFASGVISGMLSGIKVPWPGFHLSAWNYTTVDDNVRWLMLLAGLFVGILLFMIGFMKGKKK